MGAASDQQVHQRLGLVQHLPQGMCTVHAGTVRALYEQYIRDDMQNSWWQPGEDWMCLVNKNLLPRLPLMASCHLLLSLEATWLESLIRCEGPI